MGRYFRASEINYLTALAVVSPASFVRPHAGTSLEGEDKTLRAVQVVAHSSTAVVKLTALTWLRVGEVPILARTLFCSLGRL